MSRWSEARREIAKSGSPLEKHSMNQARLAKSAEGERRIFGRSNHSVFRSAARQEKYLADRKKLQLSRAIQKISEQHATPEDISYVQRHRKDFLIPRPGGEHVLDNTQITEIIYRAKDKAYS